jgi:hypothetical protein
MKHEKQIYWLVIGVLVVVLLISFIPVTNNHYMSMDEKRESFISLKNDMIGEMISQGSYRCCLEKPCVYCIEKTPGHGEGATCDCLNDVVNGKHPCGECIGEILEGHGNPYLKEYFAEAIAEETGQIEAIEMIIEEKYG